MKSGNAHDVPLSRQAVKILEQMSPLTDVPDDALVFPGVGGRHAIASSMVLSKLRKMGKCDPYGKPIDIHGFRASFRAWTIEQARATREVCEAALAHGESDKTVAAYTHGANMFDDRVELMQDWADFAFGANWNIGE